MSEFKSEAKLTFMESTGVIIGHGVGAGVLTVPYIVSHNNWVDFIWIGLLAFFINVLLHLMVAELSYNEKGAQFITCFKNTLLTGKAKKPLTIVIFAFLCLSVLLNCVTYIAGSASSISILFGMDQTLSRIIFFVFAALVVYFGMKVIGICEKYCAYIMAGVLVVLSVFVFTKELHPLNTVSDGLKAGMALYGVISFSLSSVMSVPTVVKGLDGDKKKIKGSIILGLSFDMFVVFLLAFLTLFNVGNQITENGALNDIANINGGWIGWICALFNILALSTSFWANTLNLRDNIHETTNLDNKICWLIAAVPTLALSLIYSKESFKTFAMIASGVQVATGLAIIVAYGISRKKTGNSALLGKWGSLFFMILVAVASLIATIGSLLKI